MVNNLARISSLPGLTWRFESVIELHLFLNVEESSKSNMIEKKEAGEPDRQS